MHLAASEGRLETVQLLVALGADVNAADRWGGTPLGDAVLSNHEACIAYSQYFTGVR